MYNKLDGNPYAAYSPICAFCRRLNLSTTWGPGMIPNCQAFDQIPLEIWNGENQHQQPFPGDHGKQFEAVPGAKLPDYLGEVTQKHLAGRHNQKRHGWRYGAGQERSIEDEGESEEFQRRKRDRISGRPESMPKEIRAAKQQIIMAREKAAGRIREINERIEGIRADLRKSGASLEDVNRLDNEYDAARENYIQANKKIMDIQDHIYDLSGKIHQLEVVRDFEGLTPKKARDLERYKKDIEESLRKKDRLNEEADRAHDQLFEKSRERDRVVALYTEKNTPIKFLNREKEKIIEHYGDENGKASEKVLEWERGNAAHIRAQLETQIQRSQAISEKGKKDFEAAFEEYKQAQASGASREKLDEIEQRMAAIGAARQAGNADVIRYTETPLRHLDTKEGIPVEVAPDLPAGAYKDLANHELAWFVGDNPLIRVGSIRVEKGDEPRAYAKGDNDVFMGNSAISSRARDVFVHEMGHIIEHRDPLIRRNVENFFERRTAGQKPQRLKDVEPGRGYDDDEITIPDKFINSYMGKIYAGNFSSEILSMGIEMFYSNPVKLMRMDPDYFDFIYAVLRLGD